MSGRQRIKPGPGQESVWDYPRPPALERTHRRIRVIVGGTTIADSASALRVLETSHPPVYYLPPSDVRMDLLRPNGHRSFCEFKGMAGYVDLRLDDRHVRDIAWRFTHPAPGYEALRDHLAFYPSRVDEALVDDAQVAAQEGDFYGGWITPDVVGPFKGPPGTRGW
jgi:uncharacterized protein (DUF427 family)